MFVKKKEQVTSINVLFPPQIKEEFRRITTIHLERTFLTKLDLYKPKLREVFAKKGGVAGTKIRPLLDSIRKVNSKMTTKHK